MEEPNTRNKKRRKIFFWGEVIDDKGNAVTARFSTGDGYDVTAVGIVVVADYLLQDHKHKGYYTPSILMGKELVDQIPGYSGIEFSND